jgi:hypothetical protein
MVRGLPACAIRSRSLSTPLIPTASAVFWAAALGYVVPPAPPGHETWDDYYRALGVPEDELGAGDDRLADPDGVGPPIWFQKVPESKTVKNRIHLDIKASGGRAEPIETRRERVDAEVARLLAIGATTVMVHDVEGLDHYAVTLHDPEGNEFCVN